jgi:uncharacterized protein (DUF885 family)
MPYARACTSLLLLTAALAACRSSDAPTTPPPAPTAREATSAVATAAPIVKAEEPDDAEIAKAGQAYVDLLVAISPETATELGLHKNDAELDDRTTKGFDDAVEREEKMLGELEQRFAKPRASAGAKTDLVLIEGALRVDVRVKRLQRPLQRQPDYYAAPLEAIFLMTARDYAPAAERAKNVLARLEKLPKTLEAAKANLLNPPKVWTDVGIERAASAKSFLEEQRPFLEQALPNDKAHVDTALKGAEAAFADYEKFLKKEVAPRSNGRFAAGRELFEFLLANDYFVEENAEQILAFGKKVFGETQKELDAVAKKIDPNAKGWPDVVAKLKANHPAADDLLASYKTEVKRARDFLLQKDAIELPPGESLDVIDTPAFLRSTTTAAYDQPPPFDPGTKGFFFVTPADKSLPAKEQEKMLREHDHGDQVDTAVHETYPGHHLQLSWARRHPSVVRKALGTSVFAEGWGLYSEELMSELGYYTNEERLMQLEWTLVRAARVVIDVGLHVGTMSFEDAVKMLTDEVHLEKPLAVSEVKRYTLSPTQPLSYLLGRQKIFEMREKYKAREGAKFALKKFHTDVLSRGTIPPSLMAKEIFGGP